MPRIAGSIQLGITAIVLASCYEYRQIDLQNSLPNGMAVRVELSDAGTANVVPAIGPSAAFVEGTIQNADTGSVTLSLEVVRRKGQEEARWHGETLMLRRGDIRDIEERKTSRGRTAIAVAAVTSAGVALIVAVARATGLVSGNPSRPPVPGT
jgi:hypothetical protein